MREAGRRRWTDSLRHIAAYGALFAVLGYACMLLAAQAEAEQRIGYLRYWGLFATAMYALLPPHLLLPDPKLTLLRYRNPSPCRLLLHQLMRWLPIVVLLATPSLILGFYHPSDTMYGDPRLQSQVAAGMLVMLGTGLFSFLRYMTVGTVSQEWQEGKRGRFYRTLTEQSNISFGVPFGLVPVFGITSLVFAVGISLAVLTAYMPIWGQASLVWLPGLIALLLVTLGLVRQAGQFDRQFYRTNALYKEIFRSAGGVHVAEREPIPYGAVYWVPPRWKPHVWAGLRQLDRRMPLGRLIFAGHVLLWLFFLQESRANVIAAYLLIFSVLKNSAVLLLSTMTTAPRPFQLLIQPAGGWTLTRFFVNLRWTLPYLLSLLIVTLFSQRFSVLNALSWVLLDVVLSLFMAWLVTVSTEVRHRYRYA